MHLFSLLALVAATASSSTVHAALIKVQVGKNSTGGLATVFNPNQVTAQVGDMIQFEFMGKNHSVTQSSFAEPCTRQLNTALNLPGADSGFMPVAANATEIPTWTIQVNNAKDPQWFFCNQAQHCNAGMVFAINAPTTGAKTFEAFLAKAKNATHPDPALNQTAPFTPPAESSSPSSSDLGTSPTANASATATDSTGTSTTPTDALANAAPNLSSSSSAAVSVPTSSGSGVLSLSAGTGQTTVGTAAADRVSSTSTGTAISASTTLRNAGYKMSVGGGSLQVAATVMALGLWLL